VSAVVEQEPALRPWDYDKPAKAHYPDLRKNESVALCGVKLIGVPAPPSHPLCQICQQRWLELNWNVGVAG
jgi:hypothetical protein